jgi:hypothetical protein
MVESSRILKGDELFDSNPERKSDLDHAFESLNIARSTSPSSKPTKHSSSANLFASNEPLVDDTKVDDLFVASLLTNGVCVSVCHYDGCLVIMTLCCANHHDAETKATDVLLAPANTEGELLAEIYSTYGAMQCNATINEQWLIVVLVQ